MPPARKPQEWLRGPAADVEAELLADTPPEADDATGDGSQHTPR